jgi:hypothetical protein
VKKLDELWLLFGCCEVNFESLAKFTPIVESAWFEVFEPCHGPFIESQDKQLTFQHSGCDRRDLWCRHMVL